MRYPVAPIPSPGQWRKARPRGVSQMGNAALRQAKSKVPKKSRLFSEPTLQILGTHGPPRMGASPSGPPVPRAGSECARPSFPCRRRPLRRERNGKLLPPRSWPSHRPRILIGTLFRNFIALAPAPFGRRKNKINYLCRFIR